MPYYVVQKLLRNVWATFLMAQNNWALQEKQYHIPWIQMQFFKIRWDGLYRAAGPAWSDGKNRMAYVPQFNLHHLTF